MQVLLENRDRRALLREQGPSCCETSSAGLRNHDPNIDNGRMDHTAQVNSRHCCRLQERCEQALMSCEGQGFAAGFSS